MQWHYFLQVICAARWGGPSPDKELPGCNQFNQVCLTRAKQGALIKSASSWRGFEHPEGAGAPWKGRQWDRPFS